MGPLTPEIVERILRQLGIDIAERYPRRFVARCRSGEHPDRHPSWAIATSGDRAGQHHCRSCKWGGSIIDLIMHVRDEGFVSAKTWLTDLIGGDGADYIPVDEIRVIITNPNEKGFKLPPEIVIDKPALWPPTMLRYAVEDRRIPIWQLERWKVGYATFGRLAGRICFVTYDSQWRPTNYTGRTVVKDPKRYCNASEDENPDFSVLFGEVRWPKMGSRKRIVVTEGAIDGFAVERAVRVETSLGGLNGSNVHPLTVAKLATFDEVIVLTDNDPAGDKAAAALEAGLCRQTEVRRVILPKKTDAASLPEDELRQWLSD